MQGGVHIIKEVPHVPNDDAHKLVPRHGPVQHEADAHQHPRQVRRAKDEQPQKAHEGVRVAARPNVDEGRRQRVAEEGHRDEGREEQERRHGVHEQPREVGRRAARRLLEQAGVALEEVDVEEEVDGDGAEVEEGGEEAPVLGHGSRGG